MTIADKIRAMTDEELAGLLGDMVDHVECSGTGCKIKESGNCGWPYKGCDESASDWLRQEVTP